MSDERKYKAEVIMVNAEQAEKATEKTPEGTWYLKALWRCTHEQVSGEWVELDVTPGSGDDLINKRYYLNPEPSAQGKRSSLEISKEQLKAHFGYDGIIEDIQSIIGYKNVLVVETVNGYDNIKWVNNPTGVKPICPKEKMNDLAAIFNKA